MKKLFFFFAAMMVAVAMNATPVVLPATLDVTNVSFRSAGMPDFVLEDGDYAGTYFDMGAHDSSEDTLLYAEWDVTIQPIKYNLAVDVYNTNGWRVQLYLLNQAGDTVKSLRYKGSENAKGQFSIGSLDLSDLEAGNYKVRARAATAWSKMKLKDVIFEGDYQGVSVELPATLLPAYALLSDGASVTNKAIAFAPATANKEYAKWNVSFAEAGYFNIAIDITASNGHNYGVALLSADGTTRIDSVAEGDQYEDTGVKTLGYFEVPAAGNYIVKLTNAVQWSEAVLNSIKVTKIEPKTLYCYVEKGWWKDGGAKVNCYAKIQDGPDNSWPGVAMEEVSTNLWKVVIPGIYEKINFTRVNPDQDTYWGAKTDEMAVPINSNLFTITSNDAQWDSEGHTAKGSWSVKDAKYYIAGNMTDWGNDKIGALADEQVLSLAAGKYQMKVVGKDWYGMNKLTSVAKRLYPDQDGNICFTLAEAGDVTINFVEGETITTFTLAGAFALPSVKLIGAGTEFGNWEAANAVAFTNDEGDLSASHTFTLAAGDYEFKMIREWEWLTLEGEDGEHNKKSYDMHRTWTTASGFYRDSEYYPLKLIADMDGNYKFTWTYATGELAITFPAKDPTALDNTAVEGKATKTIVNGMLLITRDGKTYNVLGTQVK